MKTIIIQTDDPERSQKLIEILAMAFPECRIQIIPKHHMAVNPDPVEKTASNLDFH